MAQISLCSLHLLQLEWLHAALAACKAPPLAMRLTSSWEGVCRRPPPWRGRAHMAPA